MAGETERRKAQNIILENRSRLSVSGVEEVSGFDESIVQMQTELGALTVHGSNLRVETLSVWTPAIFSLWGIFRISRMPTSQCGAAFGRGSSDKWANRRPGSFLSWHLPL